MTLYSISLWAGVPGPVYGDDGYETNYCGCWHVPCDPVAEVEKVDELRAAGAGLFMDEDGKTGRCFFTADELHRELERAEAASGCYAVELVLDS